MGKFSVESMRHFEPDHWRVLTSVEMGMKNHEFVSLQLVSSLANIYRGLSAKLLGDLAKASVVSHERGPKYDGYRLTTLGYDYLALHALCQRDAVGAVGNQIGVGKESDIYVGGDGELRDLVLKFHRLGRTSFRKIKEKRDYHGKRHFCSWLYLSRIAALKEFTFMRALYEREFPVPKPFECCRHTVVMELIEGFPLASYTTLNDPEALYEELMSIIVRLARHGLIHGDFNEFNIILTKDEKPVIIDFPQMVSIDHLNAEFYFKRDVDCVRTFFRRRFDYELDEFPVLAEIAHEYTLDLELKASGADEKPLSFGSALDEIQLNGVAADAEHDDEATSDVDEEAVAATSDDAEKAGSDIEERMSMCTVTTSIAPEEIKKRLLKERNKAKKEKLRVKGKQSTVQRGRRQNINVIKEYAGWDDF